MILLLKHPLAFALAAAAITWWLLRKKADCHCDDVPTSTNIPPPATNIWGGYTGDPYAGTRTSGCPQGLIRDVNSGNCVTPIG
ncbi:MAG TPA: hypothetical protein VJV75_03755 [Candidatus Polarisedimenticolia bacterium]|nr:hypothetical protein [Candidatus Polarisedimenticolia bacterium]